jgi:hypothetical protein
MSSADSWKLELELRTFGGSSGCGFLLTHLQELGPAHGGPFVWFLALVQERTCTSIGQI